MGRDERIELVEVSAGNQQCAASALETGNILFFPETPFELSGPKRQALLAIAEVPGAHHKNIAFKPHAQKVTGLSQVAPETRKSVENALRSYTAWAVRFVAELLPSYARAWQVDYSSFRPVEERNRRLPWKKRNDLIHTDAFPSRPTHGGLILRLFTNLNGHRIACGLSAGHSRRSRRSMRCQPAWRSSRRSLAHRSAGHGSPYCTLREPQACASSIVHPTTGSCWRFTITSKPT